ncbi:ATP-binding protein [Bdellovibrio sp. HCB337]|uniref:PAS domain-containing sensor histidine kinase n=1 Tax=Bdellovibrio sp. HCB337 TaxID=3394358 RepID=UPI0039A5057E
MDNSISVTTVLSLTIAIVAFGMGWFLRRRLTHETAIKNQLRISRENLDFALQSGQMGTWDLDLATNTVSCSKEMLDLWGVTIEEYNNQRSILQSKVHPEDLETMRAAIVKAVETSSIYELEYRIYPKPDQMKWVFARGRCSYNSGSQKPVRLSGVVFDITERKQREQALAQTVHMRDQFLTIAGHELKTPLTNMQMQIQLRLRDLKRKDTQAFTPEKIEDVLNEQYGYVRRMNRLVEDMLDVSQISEGRLRLWPERFDLCELISEVIRPFENVKFLSAARGPLMGSWDRIRIEQVIVNLLTNAVKYGNSKPIEISLSQEGDHVRICVRDQGIGIAAHDHARVFQRYERAISENEVCGFGLGLYISNYIVQLHGGEIRLQSEIGQGSEFTVILPIQRGQA